MTMRNDETNNILAWLILGYLCSHPDAKDTAAGIGTWWLPSEGIHVDKQRIMDALLYLDNLGWLTKRGESTALKVYGLKKERRSALEEFLYGYSQDTGLARTQDMTSIL